MFFTLVLNDPHLVSCCGHHFCGTCIKRVKDSNGVCPYCKEKEYQTVPNKDRLRIINGLKVNCTNKGCEWKGELKDLSVHLNKGKREGQCQYEEVTCVHSGCEIKKQRQYLVEHEKNECPQRPYQCRYCHHKGTYQFIVKEHHPQCTQYPVLCPNKCGLQAIPRCNVQTHVTEECPLQSVECEFKWAGCQYTPLRKDLQQHNNDSQLKHMSLLAKECREKTEKHGDSELKNEIEDIKCKMQIACNELKKEIQELTHKVASVSHECEELKKEKDELKKENEELLKKGSQKELVAEMKKVVHDALAGDTYPILPVHVPLNGAEVHFYSDACGHHMSVSVMTRTTKTAIFTVYKGKFQQPKVTQVVVKLDSAIKTIDARSGCHGYQEYPLKDDIVQKFSFMLGYFYNLQIISVS